MALHLSAVELDHVQQLLHTGKSPAEIHHSLRRLCGRRGVEAPHITNLRRMLKRLTYIGTRSVDWDAFCGLGARSVDWGAFCGLGHGLGSSQD